MCGAVFKQGLSIERVKNLYHMLNTLVGQCRIYLHTKSTFKIYDKCRLSFNHIIETLFLLFLKKTCLITQSKLLLSVYLRICINDIAICTKVSHFTDLVRMETFGTSIWRIILFILLKII